MMEIWVCEYSPSQGAFHVDTLDRILSANRRATANGTVPGYIPLYAAASSEDAHAFAERWQQLHPAAGTSLR